MEAQGIVGKNVLMVKIEMANKGRRYDPPILSCDDQGGININRELRQVRYQMEQNIIIPIHWLEYWVGQMKQRLKLMERQVRFW